MSHDFEHARRRWERRRCKRCGGVFPALHVETGMVTPCRGEPVPPPPLAKVTRDNRMEARVAIRERKASQPTARTRAALGRA